MAAMRPRVIVHHSVAIDGAVQGFVLDPGSHYGALGELEVGGFLVDAAVALDGVGDDVPPETEADRAPRAIDPADPRAIWFVVDGRGALEGKLHIVRRYQIKDVVVIGCASTPASYRQWLADRHYRFHEAGTDDVDLSAALEKVGAAHGVERLVTDVAPRLAAALFAAGVVDELSLLVFPNLIAGASPRWFQDLRASVQLDLADAWALESGAIHLRWTVRRS
jgi:2,5-diamino-6-(ribosylamino)-4(3H)-pyrimidinone 5'-phosphate reductase